MGRQNDWQQNQWGKTIDLQRSDLWLVDLSQVVTIFRQAGLFGDLDYAGIKPHFYAQSCTLPEWKVNAEVTRRDSRPYNMPGADEALGAITLTFVQDVGTVKVGTNYISELQKLFTLWRAVVRAGRGGMSVEDSFILNANYSTLFSSGGGVRALHAHNVFIYLLKGGDVNVDEISDEDSLDTATALENSTVWMAKNSWLSSLKVSDLNYAQGNAPVTLTAQLFAEDISLVTGIPRRYLEPLPI